MNTIHKYKLKIDDFNQIALPKDSQILTVQMQDGSLCLWALVPVTPVGKTGLFPLTKVEICIVGTGNPFPDAPSCVYIATVQDGPYVWHVFKKR